MRQEDKYIRNLDDRVGHLYESTKIHLNYCSGELDYIGVYENGYWDIYEVKSSQKGIAKAIKQLRRARKFFPETLNTFVYIGREDLLGIVRGREVTQFEGF